jgi:hypothetical protein
MRLSGSEVIRLLYRNFLIDATSPELKALLPPDRLLLWQLPFLWPKPGPPHPDVASSRSARGSGKNTVSSVVVSVSTSIS